MKTISISGKEVKSKPVSLSKAAKYLANFVETDNGASEANLGFLKRASAAFNELNAFHKEIRKLKSRQSGGEGVGEDGMSAGDRSEVVVEDGKESKKKWRDVKEEGVLDNLNNNAESRSDGRKRKKLEDGRFEDADEKKLKKKRKKNRDDDE
ncbi:hypothetical protein QQ045_003294 [Rhodiola kirilowii]